MTIKTKAYIALGIVCVAWGTTYLAMRTGVKTMPGLMLAALRNTICGIIVVGWFLIKGHRFPDIKTLGRLALISALLLGVGNGFMTWGEETVPSGLAAVLAALNPLCIAFFSILLMKGTKISIKAIAGLVLGLAGIITIFFPLLTHPGQKGFAFGVLLIVLAVLGWSSGSILIARKPLEINVFYAAGWEFLLGGVELVIFSLITGHTISLAKVSLESWTSISYLIVIGSLIGFNAYQYALKHLPPTQASIYAYVNPIVALLLGWVLLHEHLNFFILFGSVITLAGVYLVQSSFRQVKRKMNLQQFKNGYLRLRMKDGRKNRFLFRPKG